MPESLFTQAELEVIALYRDPRSSDLRRATRLSIQYLLAGGIFTFLAVTRNEPWLGAVTYAVFVVFVSLRLLGARRTAGLMPQVLTKYEKRIAELAALASHAAPSPP